MKKGSLTKETQSGSRLLLVTQTMVHTFSKALYQHEAFSHFTLPQLHLTTTKRSRQREKWVLQLIEILGNISIVRKYTSCKSCPCIWATRLFLCIKLKVEMNANLSAFRKLSFDVTKNKKDLTFLSNTEHSQWEQKIFCFGCYWWNRYIFLFFFLLFKTRIKASSDFQFALVFITPRAIRVDSAYNSSNKDLLVSR